MKNESARENLILTQPRRLNRIIDLSKQKFNKLKPIRFLGMNHKRTSVWECICDCGNKINASSTSLTRNLKKSCGCNHLLKKKTTEERGVVYLFKVYRNVSKRRNLIFQLKLPFFKKLITSTCFYCGSKPMNKRKLHKGDYFYYNGIDRVNNKIGYIKGNVVSCCKECNKMKSDKTIKEFVEYTKRLVEYSKNWLHLYEV